MQIGDADLRLGSFESFPQGLESGMFEVSCHGYFNIRRSSTRLGAPMRSRPEFSL